MNGSSKWKHFHLNWSFEELLESNWNVNLRRNKISPDRVTLWTMNWETELGMISTRLLFILQSLI